MLRRCVGLAVGKAVRVCMEHGGRQGGEERRRGRACRRSTALVCRGGGRVLGRAGDAGQEGAYLGPGVGGFPLHIPPYHPACWPGPMTLPDPPFHRHSFPPPSPQVLAGALKDNRRGVIVGEQTFGKGLIQTLVPLSDGSALAVTVAKYQTPGGVDINKIGISPQRAIDAADLLEIPTRGEAFCKYLNTDAAPPLLGS